MMEWLFAGIIVAVFALAWFAITYFMKKSIKNAFQRVAVSGEGGNPPEGYVEVTENAQLMEVQSTSMMINEQRVMKVQIALFPAEGSMIALEISRAFTYAELPHLVPNTAVKVSYHIQQEKLDRGGMGSDLIQNLRIVGPGTIEWEGDPRVKAAAAALLEQIQGSKMLDAQGLIMNVEKTGALLNGNPVYRYEVRFETGDGQLVEGETYQAARPWLELQRRNSSRVGVHYSATDPRDFILEKR